MRHSIDRQEGCTGQSIGHPIAICVRKRARHPAKLVVGILTRPGEQDATSLGEEFLAPNVVLRGRYGTTAKRLTEAGNQEAETHANFR